MQCKMSQAWQNQPNIKTALYKKNFPKMVKNAFCNFQLQWQIAHYLYLEIMWAKSVANISCSRDVHIYAYRFLRKSDNCLLRYKRFSESHLYGSPCRTKDEPSLFNSRAVCWVAEQFFMHIYVPAAHSSPQEDWPKGLPFTQHIW